MDFLKDLKLKHLSFGILQWLDSDFKYFDSENPPGLPLMLTQSQK
jgi:hypothetical protein